MEKECGIKVLKVLNVISYIIMVTVNALANILPINGIETGKVSDLYPNLFAPAGITFSIWGVIYLLLAGFVVYQFVHFKSGNFSKIFVGVSRLFIISSLANAAWIFSWHYRIIPLTMVLMVIILVSLIMANQKISSVELTTKEKLFLRLPFSIYFSWITVATIANATILLVSLGWNGWGFSEEFWAIIMIVAGMIIGVATTLKNKDIAYGIVILWAYLGILIKHQSLNGFGGKYPEIVVAVSISLAVVFITVLYVIFNSAIRKSAK